jgi:hypothetical protein
MLRMVPVGPPYGFRRLSPHEYCHSCYSYSPGNGYNKSETAVCRTVFEGSESVNETGCFPCFTFRVVYGSQMNHTLFRNRLDWVRLGHHVPMVVVVLACLIRRASP